MSLNTFRWTVLVSVSVVASALASPPTAWQSVVGKDVNPMALKNVKATVLVFISTDCPIANGYAPEIQRIAQKYQPKGFAFYLVYEDTGVTAPAAARHLQEYSYTCPALLDPTHTLAKRVSATVTPQAVILGVGAKILYSGRIDNRMVTYGKSRPTATRHDLRLSLDAILSGKRVPNPKTPSLGCFIPESN